LTLFKARPHCDSQFRRKRTVPGYRLAIPRLFAALFLLSATGIVIYPLLDALLRHLYGSASEEEQE